VTYQTARVRVSKPRGNKFRRQRYHNLLTGVRVPTIFWYWNSRFFKDTEVAFSRTNSRRTFAARTVLQQYLISISVITGILVDKNKTW